MLKLIQMEWYRLRKSTSFYVTLAVTALFFTFLLYLTTKDSFTAASFQQAVSSITVMSLYQYLTQGDILVLFVVLFSTIFLSAEFNSGYIKNFCGKENKKYRLPLSVLLVCMVFILALFVIAFLFSIISSKLAFDSVIWDNQLINWIKYTGEQFLLNTAFCALALFVYYLIRNNLVCIAISFFYITYGDILYQIIDPFVQKSLSKVFHDLSFCTSDFTLLGNLYSISFESSNADFLRATLVALIVGMLSIIFSTLILRKRDFK